MNGFVVLDKKEGITSFKAAAFLRKVYGEKKTGHTGTLDPLATGVLPVALGRATRFIDFLPSNEKEYIAGLRFGITTDTLDITGKILSEKEAKVTEEDLMRVLPMFRGEILQTPPMFSALLVNGERLYDLARKGIEVEREARKVTVFALEVLGQPRPGEFEIRVACSKGTYIRSLIDDMGKVLGVGAVMTSLRRTKSNGFRIENAFPAEEVEKNPAGALLPVDFPFMGLPEAKVTEKQALRFRNGGELSLDRIKCELPTGLIRVYSPDSVFLGLGEVKEKEAFLYAKRVLGHE